MRILMLGVRGVPTEPPAGVAALPGRGRELFGGAERAAEGLATGLAARGHDVTVLCRAGRTLVDLDRWQGIELRTLPCVRTKHLEAISHTAAGTADVLAHEALARVRGGHAYDVVHYHASGPSLLSFAPRLGGVPTVSTVHTLEFHGAKWGAFAKFVLRTGSRAAAAFPHRTIVVSRALEAHYRDLGHAVTYIPNGVEAPRRRAPGPLHARLGLQPGRYVFFLGRIIPEKDPLTLLEAFRRVDTDWKLVLAGGASFTGEFAARVQAAAARDGRVVMPGGLYDADKDEALSNGGLFVLPSALEGLSIALLEAMSHGLPTVVSDIPGNREATGPIAAPAFPVGDADALAAHLRRLIADAAARETLGAAARAHVEKTYTWGPVVERTERVYAEALAEARG